MVGRQVLVAIGMTVAAIVVFFAWTGPLHPVVNLPTDDVAERLAFAAKWLLVPGFALLIGIGFTANRRFFVSDAIDGSPTPQSKSLEINLRYNRNTLEQAMLVAIAWPLLALWLPAGQLGLIPVLAVLFGFGRVAFWIGYLIAPWARAFGFALTFYPTVAAFIWLAVRVLR
jgi:hypothetical protein